MNLIVANEEIGRKRVKIYPSIPGPKKFIGFPCIAFEKKDGSNLRFEFQKKGGWFKFGTRQRLFDKSDPDFGEAIDLFMELHSANLEKLFADKYPNDKTFTVFCEFFGENSFAGQHVKGEQKNLVIFDVEIHKKGFVLPRDFLRNFGSLPNTAVVEYEGPFSEDFIQSIRNSETLDEGVVAKGLLEGRKPSIHALWMSKVKTKRWLDKVAELAKSNPQYETIHQENSREQV